eukprot:CAMPEP_0201687076 /NCGR_PEP_ID=MMETSP0578-20130828/1281_1 /ASSEMBLY_ACC=CAM_ASM_000663 /TAXON_ID=267565 /ORGANISM="Skeletonema grethea, Strain CCMP 1804" /LENGTH=594 /DNA_ID=CAMNT_0048171199 /DNA_START=94 /DNA_END=1878 /DNA_ORIENTATION=-
MASAFSSALKRRVASPMTVRMTADAPPHVQSISGSKSTKRHPQTANNMNQAALPPLSPTRQKYRRFFLPNSIVMSVLLLLAAVVPFIMYLHYFDPQQPNNQQHGHKMFEHGQVRRAMELSDTQYVVPSKRDHFLRHTSSNTIKFHSFSRRESGNPLPPWNFHMPDSEEVIKLDGMTVSLYSGVVANSFRGRVQGSNYADNDEEMNTRVDGEENASSQDAKVHALTTTETAAWDPDQECIPMADWQTTFKPSCNSVHEMDMPFLLNKDAYSLVSEKGFWRNAWNIDMNVAENGMSPMSNIVIKSLKYIHEPNFETFELNRVDGVSMEQLTHSQYITDIYGYCGTTSLQEFAGAGSLDTFLRELDPIGKLEQAAWVAQGIADIHEIGKKKGGDVVSTSFDSNSTEITASLIHNDINLGNILMGYRDGKRVPLINDFNIAIFRKKDASTGAPCRFRGLFFNPQWMAPEQMNTKDREDGLSIGFLDEKIDVYALGNILHFVAIGQPPWKFNGRKRAKEIGEEYYQKKKAEWDVHITRSKLKGVKPQIPDEVKRSDDPSIQAVLNAMNRCYRSDPDMRSSAREIADYLKDKFLELNRKQ